MCLLKALCIDYLYDNNLIEHNNVVTKSRYRNNETFSRAHKSVPGLLLSKSRMALVLPSYNIGHRHTRHLFQATILLGIIKYYEEPFMTDPAPLHSSFMHLNHQTCAEYK